MKIPYQRLQKPRGFTLIELLVVISIIALLATMGVAGGQLVIKKARNLQAASVMKGLEIAIKSYKTEYLRMPSAQGTINQDNDGYNTADEEGRALLDVLTSADSSRNPRQIRFWDPPPTKSGGAGYSPEMGLRDPWGKNGYMVVIDYNGDGQVANPYGNGSESEPTNISTDVIVYCAGANGIFEQSGASKKVDDVKSWQ